LSGKEDFMQFLHENTPMSSYGLLGCKLFCGSGLDARLQQSSATFGNSKQYRISDAIICRVHLIDAQVFA